MKKVTLTLKQAVEDTINFYSKHEGEFSIWTLTNDIKNDFKNGKYKVEGRLQVWEIYHDTVKSIFLEVQDRLNVGMVRTQKSPSGELFRIYGALGAVDTMVNIRNRVNPVPNDPTPFVAPAPIDTVGEDRVSRIISYLSNKGRATLKQIQSALKEKGITCDKIREDLLTQDTVTVTGDSTVSKYVATFKSQ